MREVDGFASQAPDPGLGVRLLRTIRWGKKMFLLGRLSGRAVSFICGQHTNIKDGE